MDALVGETPPLPTQLLLLLPPRAAAATVAISTRFPAMPSSRKSTNLWLGVFSASGVEWTGRQSTLESEDWLLVIRSCATRGVKVPSTLRLTTGMTCTVGGNFDLFAERRVGRTLRESNYTSGALGIGCNNLRHLTST